MLAFRPDPRLPILLECDRNMGTGPDPGIIVLDPKARDPFNERLERGCVSCQSAPDLALDAAEAIPRLQASHVGCIGLEGEEIRGQAGCDVLQDIQSLDRRTVAFPNGFLEPLHLAPIVKPDV